MGYTECRGEHDFAATNLGAGMARRECRRCGAMLIDLDAAEDGAALVTSPGLFGPAKPTIFSVLAEERREREKTAQDAHASPVRRGPVFAFGGATRRR